MMNINPTQPTNARLSHPSDKASVDADDGSSPLLSIHHHRCAAINKRGLEKIAKKTSPEAASKSNSNESAMSASETAPRPLDQVFDSKPSGQKSPGIRGNRKLRYDDQTRRPIVCLAFILPLLVFYEIGSILLGHNSFRSGIDQWIHSALNQIGFGQLALLPLVAIAVMNVWHHRNGDHWKIRVPVLAGMLIESIGLGLILFCAANAINTLATGPSATFSTTIPQSQWWGTVVGLVGSGIYEELVFRIILLVPMIYWAGQLIANRKYATVFGVIVISLLFAALHYNVFNPAGSQFELSSFVFRFAASIVFCILFLFRGFGIAAGSHVAYDVLTQV